MAKNMDLNKTVYELCNENPEIATILAELGFADILKPGMLQTMGRFMTIPKGAQAKRIDMESIKAAFKEKGYEIAES